MVTTVTTAAVCKHGETAPHHFTADDYPVPGLWYCPGPLYGDPSDAHPTPRHGDFVRVNRGNVHIVCVPLDDDGVSTMCNRVFVVEQYRPANGDEPRQCAACWEAF